MKRIALFALAAVAAGCSEAQVIVEPIEDVPVELAFESARDPREYRLETPEVDVSVAEDGTLVVETRLTEPEPCRVLDAVAHADDEGDVDLRVRLARSSAACAQVLENFTYTARIEGLPAGAWKLSVTHEFPGQDRAPRRVRIEDVEVP